MWGADTWRTNAARGSTRRTWRAVLALCALLTVCLAGCSLPSLPFMQTTITGRILGADVARQEQGQTVGIPLSATVRCGTTQVTTASNGTYRLAVSNTKLFTCMVTGPKGYAPASATIPGGAGTTITLNFDSATATTCAAPTSGGTVTCPLLALQPGKLIGTVETQSGLPVADADVTCKNLYGAASPGAQAMQSIPYVGASSATGTFSIAGLPVGAYGCIAKSQSGISTFREIPIVPGATANEGFTMCAGTCQKVTYHGGPVMHTQQIYLIYWMPKGYSLDPSGNAAFETTIARYFRDVNGTTFYDLIEQYYDYQGAPSDSVTLAATAVDTTAYEHCPTSPTTCKPAAATMRDPLYDIDIQAEVSRVLAAKGWKAGPTNAFFVVLPTGAQECEDTSASSNCTYLKQDAADCGYHSSFPDQNNQPIIYALIADANTTPGACVNPVEFASGTLPPNGNWALDAEISTISHEQFETASDPINMPSLGGWYDDSSGAQASGGDEIADLCQNDFPPPDSNGANIILHGDGYFLQAMWSNTARGCALP